MGMFDSVWVKCPTCGEENEFQSKSGECILGQYDLDNCPADVMANVNRHSPCECDCGTLYEVDIPSRKAIAIPLPKEPEKIGSDDKEHRKRLAILELHLGSEYYRLGEFHNNISNAMEEYNLSNEPAEQQDIPMEKDAVNFGIWLSKNEAESLATDHWRFRNNSTHTTAQLYKIYKIESPKEEKES